ncbi:MAG TPA: RHS repeat-associated core domain-containing protein, partial [Gemmataceae bacterium]|nr:RHS repeat-associated core domain-containing protein [Gemmataceae bacterium]
ALGNFTTVTLNGTPTNETINQQNEVTADGSASLTYDKNGNTLTDNNGTSFKYNAWSQLVSAAHNGTTIASYSVDGLGRRATENEGGTLTDVYFSTQWQVVEEDVSGSMTNQYVWSPVYVNAMVERDTPTQRLYVQQDANWNVTALVSISGTVLERYVYDPYGGVTYLTASWGSQSGSNYGWHYLFQGGRLDPATGLYDFQRRDYCSSLSRWSERDPIGFGAGDSNLYRVVNDRPGCETDPSGMEGNNQASDYVEAEIIDFHIEVGNDQISLMGTGRRPDITPLLGKKIELYARISVYSPPSNKFIHAIFLRVESDAYLPWLMPNAVPGGWGPVDSGSKTETSIILAPGKQDFVTLNSNDYNLNGRYPHIFWMRATMDRVPVVVIADKSVVGDVAGMGKPK